VDYSSKRLPARVGGYPEGVRFPARKEELLGRLGRNGVPGPLLGSSASCARGPRRRVPRTAGRLVGPATGALAGRRPPASAASYLPAG
jgi:hypothetical protein